MALYGAILTPVGILEPRHRYLGILGQFFQATMFLSPGTRLGPHVGSGREGEGAQWDGDSSQPVGRFVKTRRGATPPERLRRPTSRSSRRPEGRLVAIRMGLQVAQSGRPKPGRAQSTSTWRKAIRNRPKDLLIHTGVIDPLGESGFQIRRGYD